MRKPRHLNKRILFALFGFALCSLCCYGIFAFYEGMELICWQAQHLPYFVLEDYAHFKLPPTAQKVKVVTDASWSRCDIAVKFEMQPGDLVQFASTTQSKPLVEMTQGNCFDRTRERVVPNLNLTVQSVKSGFCGYTDEDYFNQQYVLVDTTDPQIYVVYLSTQQGFLD
jgi:hypothetical protein